MEAVLARQQQLEGVNRRLGQGAAEVRRSIGDLDLSRDKYQELRNLPDDQISVQEHVAVSLPTLLGGGGAHVCVGNLLGHVTLSRPPCSDAFVRGGDPPPGPGSRAQPEESQSDGGAGRQPDSDEEPDGGEAQALLALEAKQSGLERLVAMLFWLSGCRATRRSGGFALIWS